MNVLYITGSCLHCNTSANMSHNSFVQGLIENDCNVDIIMSDPGLQTIDSSMPNWKEANYYIYNSVSKMDRMRLLVRFIIDRRKRRTSKTKQLNIRKEDSEVLQNSNIRQFLKYVFYNLLTRDTPHYLSRKWLKNASKFKSKKKYDLVISNSYPASSHALADTLLKRDKVIAEKWIQIWEDPWYYDLYNKQKKEMILDEEKRLLSQADEIYYVSPLTLSYQKKHFANSSDKMKCVPLPYLNTSNTEEILDNSNVVFGYFGDYYSHVRNLKPFYEASMDLNAFVNIFGDTNEHFHSTENIRISGRVDIGIINKVQENTDVLIHLCNLKGGQIPGKIYHYSGTKKPIIFILDGEEEEKNLIKNYFEKFNRYHFCDNTKESIKEIMGKFITHEISKSSFIVNDFSPKSVVKGILGGC
ncbi:hypothetical protein [Bacillus pinisoli]|uniref:hypothetical protein n=1 Tax=Bacillus pinisoli TaxID=2901866 RepID=UPI001FF14D56|nr:hypothetical protein [Bacillus pinisoli]